MVIVNGAIEIFITVAEKGSVTEAAKSLFISQPAISKTIKGLEVELGIQLFHRSKRHGLRLTEAGQRILDLAYSMQYIENAMYQVGFQENNFVGGRVKVASLPLTTQIVLAPALRAFREMHPLVTVEIREGNPSEIRAMVESYAVDFALSESPFEPLDSLPLVRDEMCAFVAKGKSDPLVNLHMANKELVLCDAGMELVVDAVGKDANGIVNSTVVRDSHTAIGLVAHGNGTGVMSRLALSTASYQLETYPLEPPIHIDYGIVATNLDELTPVARELCRVIRETVANLVADGIIPTPQT